MIRALVLVALVACTQAPDEREAVRAAYAAKARRARADIDRQLAELKAQLAAAPDDLTRVRLSTALDELLAVAQRLGEETLAEAARIDSLPDRCFVKPFPDACKLR